MAEMTRGGRRRLWLALAGMGGVALGVAGGARLADYRKSPSAAANRSWHGKVVTIARAGAERGGGLTAEGSAGPLTLAEGAEVGAGMRLVTDARTHARVAFDDGSAVVLDRDTELAIEDGPRTLRMNHGALVAEVAHVDGAPDARLFTPTGDLSVLGTKFVLTAAGDRTSVEVLRGRVRLTGGPSDSADVSAGEEGVTTKGARVEITAANDMAQRVAFAERVGVPAAGHDPDADAPVSGLGELLARRPGKTDEKDHAVRLASHDVKVRIVGNLARTEIDETFANETGDDLEGIYRFPLPPAAQIERLALEVDGKLIDGAFVDKAKAAAIWRGAIQNATPHPKVQKEEIFWVPGPWRDPALLEWQNSGRFELKIFPIPKRGSRRVVIAYTETVAPVAGIRRYVYPLPQSSAIKIGRFAVDVRVLGADPKVPVQARGYELARADGDVDVAQPRAERLAQSMTDFTPSGDLSVEYALASDRSSDVTAWAYEDTAQPGDRYAVLALRPKLPLWTDARSRDQVLVLDVGRAMFGERFARARRLAEQVVQEMDRRDRFTVLVCDVTCRSMPSGWGAPGPGGAHDVDAFLAGVSQDGASDLVGAVRAAAAVAGREASRDLRVLLLSDGVASAGYRRVERLAEEVTGALPDARAEVVTVSIGEGSDAATLQEIARGGGGVLVPYAPGEALETAALDVLNATYGRTLRDVTLTLPEGMHDAAPSALAPLRAGSETLVGVRLDQPNVVGDAILRGKVGGDAFEARFPLDVRVTTDAGNAFVPRLYAAQRIADRERQESDDAARAEVVKLSERFAVPSRFTSLLVLESEAMFHAFGIGRESKVTTWTAEAEAVASEVPTGGDNKADKNGLKGEESSQAPADMEDALGSGGLGLSGAGGGGGGFGSGHGRISGGRAAAEASGNLWGPTESATAPEPAKKPESMPTAHITARPASPPGEWSRERSWPRRGQWMKREWFRRASVVGGGALAIGNDKLEAARAAARTAPDERSRTKELARVLALDGLLDELGDVVSAWSERDPLDVDAIAARADLVARRGDRDEALRVMSGIAASIKSGSPAEAATLEGTLALAHERAGKPAGCAFRIAAAELRPNDSDAVARAVACERAQGHAEAADRWASGLKTDTQRASVAALAAKFEPVARGGRAEAENTGWGDVVVDATWDAAAGEDLDIVIIDPQGNRASWSGRTRNVKVSDPTSPVHERLALTSWQAGPFTVEIVRAGKGGAPLSGSVSVRALGETATRSFVLNGSRAPVARVDVSWDSRLVPTDAPPGER
jgi:hypothetical protein